MQILFADIHIMVSVQFPKLAVNHIEMFIRKIIHYLKTEKQLYYKMRYLIEEITKLSPNFSTFFQAFYLLLQIGHFVGDFIKKIQPKF